MNTSRFRDRNRGGGRGASHGHERRADHRDTGQAHPSYLALDRAALGETTAELARHLDGCARCRDHVSRIADPSPAPAFLRREARKGARRPTPRRTWAVGIAAAAAAAAILLVLFPPGRPETSGRERMAAAPPPAATEPEYDTAKGGRAVGVYVRRGRHTFLWNGSEPVQPGDMIRLKLVPEGMTQVHVFSELVGGDGAASLSLLHRSAIAPDRDILLETAWRIDGSGDREVLVVVLARRPLSAEAALAAAREASMGERVWVARLVLPKRAAAESSHDSSLEGTP